MHKLELGACSAFLVLSLTGAAQAQGSYTRDAITAIAPDRHASFPSATCTIWANAEGLGVGPQQLDGLHGVAFAINEHPLPSEGAGTSFDAGLAWARKEQSKAPAWMFDAIAKHRAAIEAACAKDSETPIVISKLTARDKG